MRRKPNTKQQYLKRKYPRCGHRLVVRTNRSTDKQFVGCSNYPDCKYTKPKSIIDYVCADFNLDWKPNIHREATGLLHHLFWGKNTSRKEVHFILGIAYFLDHKTDIKENGIQIVKDKVFHKNNEYDSLVFLEPYAYWGGGFAPSAMAVVPQLRFADNFHHDFGIFFAPEHSFTPKDWRLHLAIEVDFHPHHFFNQDNDKYRDSLVDYKVIRLLPNEDKPLTWFQKVIDDWEELALEELGKNDGTYR